MADIIEFNANRITGKDVAALANNVAEKLIQKMHYNLTDPITNSVLTRAVHAGDIAINMENAVKEILPLFNTSFTSCSLLQDEVDEYVDVSNWHVDENGLVTTLPLTYYWEKDGDAYELTVFVTKLDLKHKPLDENPESELCYACLRKTKDRGTFSYDFDSNSWLPCKDMSDLEELVDEFSEDHVITGPADLEFLYSIADLMRCKTAEELTDIYNRSEKLLQLYRATSDFMTIGSDIDDYLNEDDTNVKEAAALASITLSPDSIHKCGVLIKEENGTLVVNQYLNCFHICEDISLGVTEDDLPSIPEYEYNVAHTTDIKAVAKLLDKMYARYSKHLEYDIPLSLTAFVRADIAYDIGEKVCFVEGPKRKLTVEEKKNLKQLKKNAEAMVGPMDPLFY